MANKRIQDLEQTTDLTNDDLIPLDTTKKTFATTLKSLVEWLKGTFQTTANLEQALSEATDKYPSSKVLKDESSRIVSIMNNKVSKSGDTMTGDLKIKRNSTAQFSLQNLSRDSAVNPESWGAFGLVNFFDKNNVLTGLIENWQFDDGRMHILMRVLNRKKSAQILVGVRADGTFYTECPASKTANSIETIVSSGSRYVRFGSGLQICWGAGTGEQVFPQPFRDTDYMIADSDLTYHKYEGMWTTNKTTTQFKINNSSSAQWIAIGYWY